MKSIFFVILSGLSLITEVSAAASILIRVEVEKESAPLFCRSEAVQNADNSYAACRVSFAASDGETHQRVRVTRDHDTSIIEQAECKNFCINFIRALAQFNQDEITSIHRTGAAEALADCNYQPRFFNHLESLKENVIPVIEKVHPGKTNTIPSYGVYRGQVDITESFGGFDDLESFGFFKIGNQNLDIGGGRFNDASAYLKVLGVFNSVYDPYNRTTLHNQKALGKLGAHAGRLYDSVTSMSILNVITDFEARREHIQLAHDHVKSGGVAYFKVYEGDRSGVTQGYQNHQLTSFYVDEVKAVFGPANVQFFPEHQLILGQKKEPVL